MKSKNIQTKSDQVANSIKDRILHGDYHPGFRLPPIRQLSNDFGVSIVTIQKAIKILAEKDLLEAVSGSGVFVKEKKSHERKEISIMDSWFGGEMRRKEISYDVFSMRDKTTEIFTKLASIFGRLNPDVKINLKPRGDDADFPERIKDENSCADVINLTIAPCRTFANLVQENLFLPLNEYMADDAIQAEIIPTFLKDLVCGKEIMALPMISSTNILVYNKNIFKKAGLPPLKDEMSILEIIKTARKISKQANSYGIAFFNLYAPFRWQGPDVFTPDKNEMFFDVCKLKERLRIFVEFGKGKGTIYPDFTSMGQAAEDFLNKKIGIFVTFTHFLPLLRKIADFNYGLALPPIEEGGSYPCGSTINCISKKTKYPEARWRWVRFLASLDAQKILSEIHMPINKGALPEFENFIAPGKLPLPKLIERSEFLYPNLKGFGEFVETILSYEISCLIKGIQTEEETVDRIQRQAATYFKACQN